MLTRSKVQGMVVGGAIGDAVGKPVETWTPEKILEVHPDGVRKYLSPQGHKWFPDDDPPGDTTDDEQLKTAIMTGLIEGKEAAEKLPVGNEPCGFDGFDEYHKAIAASHVAALKESDAGWGNTTREAVKKIANNCPWHKAGAELNFGGTGNGVPMKVAPWAAWSGSPAAKLFMSDQDFRFNQEIVRHAAMTHATDISAWAGVIHVAAVNFCLWSGISQYKTDDFLALVAEQVFEWGEPSHSSETVSYNLEHLRQHPTEEEDSLEHRMLWLFRERGRLSGAGGSFTTEERDELREKFGKGSCYVLNSLPFTYAYFIKNPYTPQTIIDVVEAGGDTDTNASMVGEMIGALMGIEAFQTDDWQWMIDGLLCYDRLIEMSDLFCDTFGIE